MSTATSAQRLNLPLEIRDMIYKLALMHDPPTGFADLTNCTYGTPLKARGTQSSFHSIFDLSGPLIGFVRVHGEGSIATRAPFHALCCTRCLCSARFFYFAKSLESFASAKSYRELDVQDGLELDPLKLLPGSCRHQILVLESQEIVKLRYGRRSSILPPLAFSCRQIHAEIILVFFQQAEVKLEAGTDTASKLEKFLDTLYTEGAGLKAIRRLVFMPGSTRPLHLLTDDELSNYERDPTVINNELNTWSPLFTVKCTFLRQLDINASMTALFDEKIHWESWVSDPIRVDERFKIAPAFSLSLANLKDLNVFIVDGWIWAEAQHCSSGGFRQVMRTYDRFLKAAHAAANTNFQFTFQALLHGSPLQTRRALVLQRRLASKASSFQIYDSLRAACDPRERGELRKAIAHQISYRLAWGLKRLGIEGLPPRSTRLTVDPKLRLLFSQAAVLSDQDEEIHYLRSLENETDVGRLITMIRTASSPSFVFMSTLIDLLRSHSISTVTNQTAVIENSNSP